MTTTCDACGARDQDGAFCTVCGTPTGRPARPSVATAAPEEEPGPPLAGVGRRAAAYVLDVLAVSLVAGVVGALTAVVTGLPDTLVGAAEATDAGAVRDAFDALVVVYGAIAVVSLLGWLAVALADGLAGWTIGNALLGIRTRGVDGGVIGAGRGVLRWLVLGLCGVLPLVGTVLVLVSPTFDSSGRRQGWHDKAARSVVHHVRGATSSATGPAVAGQPAPAPGAPAPAAAQPAAGAGGQGTEGWALDVPDPWAFPQEQRQDDGLITGVPGAPGPAAPPEPPAPARQDTGPVEGTGPVESPGDVAGAADADDDLEATRISATAPPAGGEPAPAPLVLETAPDRRVTVTGRVLLGRNPQQDAGERAVLVRVDDPTRSVSKTHLEIVPVAGAVRVRDLGSTNGSAVIEHGGETRALAPHTPVTVGPGWTVQAGGTMLRVLAPDAGA